MPSPPLDKNDDNSRDSDVDDNGMREKLGPEALPVLRNDPDQEDDPAMSQTQQQTTAHHTTMTNPSTELPQHNTDYFKKEYWDDRFAEEEVNNWLVTYDDVKDQLAPFLTPESKILVVGCGNSTFSEELYDAGFHNLWNVDFSHVVIEAMRTKYRVSRPGMKWVVMDMTDMSDFEDESFNVVLDKAAMDALLSAEGDVWHPDPTLVISAHCMCQHIARILARPQCHHLQISFAQPHFRKKYLLGWHYYDSHPSERKIVEDPPKLDDYSHEYCWTFRYEAIQEERGCFHHYLYIMTKSTR